MGSENLQYQYPNNMGRIVHIVIMNTIKLDHVYRKSSYIKLKTGQEEKMK